VTRVFWTILLLPVFCWSQPKTLNIDSAFRVARQLAFEGKRHDAELILKSILGQNPNYSDGQLLLARIHAWDGRYTLAIHEAQEVMTVEPHSLEARELLIDVFFWSHQYELGLLEVNKNLAQNPSSSSLLYKKALIYFHLEQYQLARETLDSIADSLLTDEATQLKKQVQDKLLKHEVLVSSGIDVFTKTFEPAYYSCIQIIRKSAWGAFIFRSNYSHRFNQQGVQPEIEFYPTLSKRNYAYLNYGYSTSPLFPEHRFGAEWFTKLSKTIEGSLGVRYLRFQSPNSVWMYTSSLTWYKKSFMLTVRPSFVQSPSLITHSVLLSGRKYFNDKLDFISVGIGTGVLPDERRLQSGTGFDADARFTVRSKNVSVGLHKQFLKNISGRLTYEFSHRELSYNSGEFVGINTFQLILSKKF
jgi:YaiO family outer membrane protein